jgi:RimJ/RimL family protein N-acetyltransferase
MITLEKFDEAFIKKAAAWHIDKETAEAVGLWDGPYSIEHHEALLESWAERYIVFGIALDRQPIGYVMIKNADNRNKSGELHITLGDKKYWGKGYGYRAYREIINFAFGKLGFNRVSTYVFSFRPDLVRIMDRGVFGFKREGILKEAVNKKGEYFDIILYGLLKKDYTQRRKPCQQLSH